MERKLARRVWLLLFSLAVSLEARPARVYTYVGRITADSFLIAWGTADGEGNTIGRDSVPLGGAIVEADGRRFSTSRKNWFEVTNLDPDKEYPYRILLEGREVGRGIVRTFPRIADRLSFFVIGDYGIGKPPQYEIARAMIREFEKRRNSGNPVRFVLTTGDNLYSDRVLGLFSSSTGGKDRDWKRKFFEPYEPLLRQIPFYPSIGNHDRTNKTGKPDDDLATYLDNFFFPSNEPSPYYAFSFGGLADFFALDTTALWPHPPLAVSLAESGGQFQWLVDALSRATSPWKIAYFHHAPFSAGPNHKASLDALAHVVRQFKDAGVQVVFSGHEHNFQFTEQNRATGGTLYVVSGAGGQLRPGEVYSAMNASGIAGTASQRHFLLVEIEEETLKITPLSSEPVIVRNRHGLPIPMPIVVNLPN